MTNNNDKIDNTWLALDNMDFIPKKRPQYLAAVSASIGAFSLGNVLGWSSELLLSMDRTGDFDGFTFDNNDATWIASIATLGCLTAAFTMPLPMQLIGRKGTMLLLVIPAIAGWITMGFSGNNIPMMLAGRFITGFCGGAFPQITSIYIGEIAQPDIRGILGNTMNVLLNCGVLFVYCMSALFEWNVVSLICAGVPLALALVCFLFVPESPRYLLMKGKEADARMSLKRLRGAQADSQVDTEFKMMCTSVEEASREEFHIRELFSGQILKPTLICMMLFVLQQLGGSKIILMYSGTVFEAADTDMSTVVQSIIIICVQVAFIIVSTLLIERLGRKVLLPISDLGMAIGLAVLGVYFYLAEHEESTANDLGWLPLTTLIFFTIAYNLGLGPLPWTMMGELVPKQAKGFTSTMASGVCWGLGFIITKFFHDMTKAMHEYGLYWLMSSVSLAGCFFSLFVVPETRGKTLDEIEALFK